MEQSNFLSGYIKLHRSILRWEWHTDPNTLSLFIHCLALANFQDTKWRGIEIPRGSFIGSIASLAEKTGLSEKQVRTSLKRLKAAGNLASQSTNRYTIYKVENYDMYQAEGKPEGSLRASKGQARGKQGATAEERKERQEGKEEKQKEKKKKEKFEPKRMIEDYTQDPSLREALLDFLDFRKSAKAAVSTKRQMQLLLNKLDQLSHGDHQKKIKIVNRSTENGWKGFFELREEKYGRTSTGYSNGDTTGAWDRVITWDDFNGNVG